MCDGPSIGWFLIGYFIGAFIAGILFIIIFGINAEQELGQSICDQEYDMDYNSYFDGKLYCKDRAVEESYDGISVVIKEKKG